MRLSRELLARVEAVLPPFGDAGLQTREVHRLVGRWGRFTIRHALRMLVSERRCVFTGRDHHRRYTLPRPPSAVGVAPRDASHGLSSLELGAGPSKAPPPLPYAVYAARAWEFQRCAWDSGAFSRAIGALRFEDITEREIRALHRKRPIIASVPVSRHPPAAWVPREAMT